MLATHSGAVFLLSTTDDPATTNLVPVIQLGARTASIGYFTERLSIVAINSFAPDDQADQIADPGAVVLATRKGASTQVVRMGALSVTANQPVSAAQPTHSIRRPCNGKKN
jgi:hypothetical protein